MHTSFSLDGTAVSASLPQKSDLQNNAFNALRFICCLMVIVGHSLDISDTPVPQLAWMDLHVCVCVFFILSGFWVTKSFVSSASLKDYALKRIKRLLPLYYLAVIGFAVCCVFYSDLDAVSYFTSGGFWKYLAWNAVFLNFMCPDLPGVFGGGVYQ